MSRKGNFYDNAVTETFFATLKKELVYRRRYQSHEAARSNIFEYIESYDNRRRLHSTLGYVSPAGFELAHYTSDTKEPMTVGNTFEVEGFTMGIGGAISSEFSSKMCRLWRVNSTGLSRRQSMPGSAAIRIGAKSSPAVVLEQRSASIGFGIVGLDGSSTRN